MVANSTETSAMRNALRQAAVQFRAYERQHLAKQTPEADEKVATNRRYAELCEAALRGES